MQNGFYPVLFRYVATTSRRHGNIVATGIELFASKQKAVSAHMALDEQKMKHSGKYLICLGITFVFFIVGSAITMTGLEQKLPEYIRTGLIMMAIAACVYFIPALFAKKDGEIARRKQEATAARESYFSSLAAEALTYGIDMETRSDRTEFMDPDYEFTAMRNGHPMDFSVREYNDEIIFMVNGERIQKNTTPQ